MKKNGSNVVVVGSSNTDLVVDGTRLPQPGETLLGGKFRRVAGGKGANQAVAAARAGARVVFVGARGVDEFGAAAELSLRKEKIDTRLFVKKHHANSGVALIFIGGKDKQNMIVVANSANDELSPQDVLKAQAAISKAGAVVLQLEIPLTTVLATARLAAKYQVPLVLNPAPARKLPKELLRLTTLITPNETEAQLLTGEKKPSLAARKLLKMGCKNVLITLGGKGALLVNATGNKIIQAAKVKVVDTVGAGDCLTGYLAALMAEGLPLDAAVELSVRAASMSVSRRGAQESMPWRNEIGLPR